jgi:hypothetical protein
MPTRKDCKVEPNMTTKRATDLKSRLGLFLRTAVALTRTVGDRVESPGDSLNTLFILTDTNEMASCQRAVSNLSTVLSHSQLYELEALSCLR